MFRRHDEILHSRVASALHPILRIEENRIENRREFCVFLIRDLSRPLYPFGIRAAALAAPLARQDRIKTPMGHHSELGLFKPLLRGRELRGITLCHIKGVRKNAGGRKSRRAGNEFFPCHDLNLLRDFVGDLPHKLDGIGSVFKILRNVLALRYVDIEKLSRPDERLKIFALSVQMESVAVEPDFAVFEGLELIDADDVVRVRIFTFIINILYGKIFAEALNGLTRLNDVKTMIRRELAVGGLELLEHLILVDAPSAETAIPRRVGPCLLDVNLSLGCALPDHLKKFRAVRLVGLLLPALVAALLNGDDIPLVGLEHSFDVAVSAQMAVLVLYLNESVLERLLALLARNVAPRDVVGVGVGLLQIGGVPVERAPSDIKRTEIERTSEIGGDLGHFLADANGE